MSIMELMVHSIIENHRENLEHCSRTCVIGKPSLLCQDNIDYKRGENNARIMGC